MKILAFRDLPKEDQLGLFFDGSIERPSELERDLEPCLQALEAHAGEWMPDVVSGKRRRKYSRAAVRKTLQDSFDAHGSVIGFSRTGPPAIDMAFSIGFQQVPAMFNITLHVQPLTLFAEVASCRGMVDLVHAWACSYPVTYAIAHSSVDTALSGYPRFGRDRQSWLQDGFDKIYEVYWLNVFGPKLVESVGRERMLSTPAWRVEELPGGAVLVVLRPTAADFASEEARQAQARVLVHLRPDLDLETVLRILRERSATLAPVEPRFYPDVAPLLSRAVDTFGLSERQRKIAEFNAWQPPEPEEWVEAAAAWPSDVEDLEQALDHYATLSEHLVALLHSQVPSVFEETPESLTDVDFHFWYEHFPETFERELIEARAVPAVGAYLGEVLVRRLGGKWIPRKRLVEAQVQVGRRVWFPFLRAQRYMGSRQSLLDYSLTQLYRAAERHRG